MYARELKKEMLLECGITNVSEKGEIFKGNVEVKQFKSNSGYKVVNLLKDGKPYTLGVHRIVYCWFNEFIPSGMVVDHIDNNKLNNSYDNLRLLTPCENIQKDRDTKDFMRKCNLKKPREFYELKLSSAQFLHKVAKYQKDKKREKSLRNTIGVLKSQLRYYDANK